MSSYGDLNDGAGGKYIYLYYTIDAWDYPRGITSIAFNDDSFGAVCGNGSTTPQDINEGAGGDYIYMHYGYTLTTDVASVTSPAYSWLTMVYIDGYDWINESNETISIYPNPTTDNVNILAPGINHVTVMNTLGQVVLDTHVDGNMTTLDMSSYQAGVYMVRVTTENGQSVKLITKQ